MLYVFKAGREEIFKMTEHKTNQICNCTRRSERMAAMGEIRYQGYPTRVGVCQVPRFHVKSRSRVHITFVEHPGPDTYLLILQCLKFSIWGAAEIEVLRRNSHPTSETRKDLQAGIVQSKYLNMERSIIIT